MGSSHFFLFAQAVCLVASIYCTCVCVCVCVCIYMCVCVCVWWWCNGLLLSSTWMKQKIYIHSRCKRRLAKCFPTHLLQIAFICGCIQTSVLCNKTQMTCFTIMKFLFLFQLLNRCSTVRVSVLHLLSESAGLTFLKKSLKIWNS